MADAITLTPQPIRVTATGLQPIYLALDIGAYDFLDMELGVVGLEGASPNVTVELWSGMQAHTDDGWLSVYAFQNVSTTNWWGFQSVTSGWLRYLRWKVTALGGTAATFVVQGMARRYAWPM